MAHKSLAKRLVKAILFNISLQAGVICSDMWIKTKETKRQEKKNEKFIDSWCWWFRPDD